MDPFCYVCFMLMRVVMACLFFVVLRSPAGKWLTSWLACVVFYRFPKCVLVHIRIKGEVGVVKLV